MEGQKTFATISGVIALFMVLILVAMASSKPATPSAQQLGRQTVKQNAPVKPSNNTVRAVVKTPVANDVKQSVTVQP